MFWCGVDGHGTDSGRTLRRRNSTVAGRRRTSGRWFVGCASPTAVRTSSRSAAAPSRSSGRGAWPDNVASYTINDISQEELGKAPAEYVKACFDICDPAEGLEGKIRRHLLEVRRRARSGRQEDARQRLSHAEAGWGRLPPVPDAVRRAVPHQLADSGAGVAGVRVPAQSGASRQQAQVPGALFVVCGEQRAHKVADPLGGICRRQVERFYGHNYLSNVPLLSSVEVAWVNAVRQAGMTEARLLRVRLRASVRRAPVAPAQPAAGRP